MESFKWIALVKVFKKESQKFEGKSILNECCASLNRRPGPPYFNINFRQGQGHLYIYIYTYAYT